ncbi:DUF2627 domain-containing protein [Tuberibacillus sp. Marseille-P3662]|uniref:DUF2627 domain-containing protein n=1 Tax=Tuberibacillus sp. Marseille-P3662 TaxID=1965358 RepID=UPI000A1C8EDA|nr:DUF2627 domain-containing protein [Tuberibacillus sp. Marseille-P3662]
MTRLMALIILVFPGILAVYGVKLMRDTLFNLLNVPYPFLWLQFLVGFIVFIVGIAFVAGWILYRDRKRNYVSKRYKNKGR